MVVIQLGMSDMNHMTTSDDSYYSDYAYDCEYEGNDDSWASSEDDADDDDDGSDGDMSDSTFEPPTEEEDAEDMSWILSIPMEKSRTRMTTTKTRLCCIWWSIHGLEWRSILCCFDVLDNFVAGKRFK